MSIIGGLRRMVTLPKAANSLSDVLGDERADMVRGIVREAVMRAVAGSVRTGAREEAERVRDDVLALAAQAPEPIRTLVTRAVYDAYDQHVPGRLDRLCADIVARVCKALGV